MTPLTPSGFLTIGDATLEYRLAGATDAPPAIVMLHEGLGSAALWGDFPDKLAAATGVAVFAYSRAGYGASSPVALPRPLTYMHDEAATVLPAAARRDRLSPRTAARPFRRRLDRGDLCGQHAGPSRARARADRAALHRRGRLLSRRSATPRRPTRAATSKPGSRAGTRNVDVAFHGWNDAWLDPAFRAWDISDALAYIRVPVQIVQGENDQYGTIRQVEIAQTECYCPVEIAMIAGAGHAPQRERPDVTLDAIAGFANRILKLHHEGSA